MLERMWRKGNTSPLLVGVPTCTATLEISMATPQENGISLPQDPALFVIARNWKQPRCPSTEKWISKNVVIYTIKYYTEGDKKVMES